ncbi:MAG TPA: C13 family peptidase, partial [Steroidobacteraceae bacterium]|nr:C13 family peptidase [Steroidobacteraceae bacterium]
MSAVSQFVTLERDRSRAMGVLHEVLAVLGLAFTFRIDGRRIVGRDATLALFGALALAVWALLTLWRLPGEPMLRLDGLPGVTAVGLAAAGVAWLLARGSQPRQAPRRTAWLVAGYLPAAAAIAWLLYAPLPRGVLVPAAALAALHASLYFFFGLRALTGRPQWRAFALWAMSIAACVAIDRAVQVDAALWQVRQSAEQIDDYAESARRAEELMYGQSERIDAALSGLQAPPADRAGVYFLGFAGFGRQKLFSNEIALAARRIGERYSAAARSLVLVNDRSDYDSHPLASPSALRRALAGVAARMDRERDVLFLALSSHGKPGARLVVDNGALPLDWLTGDALAQMLREAGIRWKVVVISACHAGAFIEHLRDPYTVVIAAAAPDRASFGCRDSRSLSYFGEAFYRDALPAAPNLHVAFETATRAIAARERELGHEPSLPQAYFGEQVHRKLAELE